MAASQNHIALANKNQNALEFVAQGSHDEWVATIAFYKAIHVVEAACRNLGSRHCHSHKTRLELMQVKKELKPIYKHFRVLYQASCIARYLYDHDSKTDYTSFGDYIPSGEAYEKLIVGRLKNVEDGLLQHLAENDRTSLARVKTL